MRLESVFDWDAGDYFEHASRRWFNMTGEEFIAAYDEGRIEKDTAKAWFVQDLRSASGR